MLPFFYLPMNNPPALFVLSKKGDECSAGDIREGN